MTIRLVSPLAMIRILAPHKRRQRPYVSIKLDCYAPDGRVAVDLLLGRLVPVGPEPGDAA